MSFHYPILPPGGSFSGSLSAKQVAFGSGANTIAGSPSFLYDTGNSLFKVGFSSNVAISLDQVGGLYEMGDVSAAFNSSKIVVNDNSKFISLTANGLQGLLVDGFAGAYTLGVNGQGNSTNVNINDSTRTVIVNATNGLILNYLGGSGIKALNVDNSGKVVAAIASETIYTSRTAIPSGQVLTLNSIPVQLVAAPAAGQAIVPVSITINLTYNTTAYAINTTLVAYTSIAAGGYMSNLLSLQDTSSTIRAMSLSSQNQVATASPLMLTVSGGNPTLGNSDIVVVVNYMLMTP